MTDPWRERWVSPGGRATLYLGDNREVWPALAVRPDAIISDPPYGMAAAGACMSGGGRWHGGGGAGQPWWNGPLKWDREAPAWVRSLPSLTDGACVIWGGQFFALPPRRGWLVWDKIIRNWSASECELAWSNLDQPVRAFDFSHGALVHDGKVHPTQKPVALMSWCLDQAKVAPGALVADPYMGAGSTGVACMRRGCRFIGIEIDESYYRSAVRRIAEAARQPDMLIEATQPARPAQDAML